VYKIQYPPAGPQDWSTTDRNLPGYIRDDLLAAQIAAGITPVGVVARDVVGLVSEGPGRKHPVACRWIEIAVAVKLCGTEAGIVHTKRGAFAICVMGKDIKDKAWTQDNEGTLAIAKMSRAVCEHFFKTK